MQGGLGRMLRCGWPSCTDSGWGRLLHAGASKALSEQLRLPLRSRRPYSPHSFRNTQGDLKGLPGRVTIPIDWLRVRLLLRSGALLARPTLLQRR